MERKMDKKVKERIKERIQLLRTTNLKYAEEKKQLLESINKINTRVKEIDSNITSRVGAIHELEMLLIPAKKKKVKEEAK